MEGNIVITIFGLGFVGLTTALGFAHCGYDVYGIDIDSKKKEQLLTGELPFMEPYLKEELEDALQKNKFIITDDINDAVSHSEYIFYCVGTPYGLDGEADLSYLFQAVRTTLDCLDKPSHKIMVVKSTVPPTTIERKIVPYLSEQGFDNGIDIDVVNNPEFLREGYCWEDFVHADRIVVGCTSEEVKKRMERLYSPFEAPFYGVSYNTAEFIKYLSNTLLATLISYSNEMAIFGNQIGGINIAEAFHILHEDKRWNHCNMSSYVYPGCGYGGYCLPKDTNALLALAKGRGIPTPILEKVISMNEKMPDIIVDSIMKKTGNMKIGVLGLSFKPESNDVRDSSSAKVIKKQIGRAHV